jgi:hypothetical protein
MNFHHHFVRVVHLIIKFITEIQNYIQTNDESNINYDVRYHLAKSQIKIQLVYGETKITTCIME